MEANCVHFTHYVCSTYIVHFAINPLSSKWKPWVEPSGSSGHPAFHARDHQLSSPYHQVNHRHHHDQDHLQVNHCHLQDLDLPKSIIIILKIKFANFVVISKHHQTFLGSEILWAISPPLRYLRHPSIVWIRLFCSKRKNTFFSCWCLWDDHHFSTHSLSYRPASRIMVIVIIIQCKDGMLVWVGVGANQYVVL